MLWNNDMVPLNRLLPVAFLAGCAAREVASPGPAGGGPGDATTDVATEGASNDAADEYPYSCPRSGACCSCTDGGGGTCDCVGGTFPGCPASAIPGQSC